MLTQMAKYLDTVYVSGWQCSSTASSTDEPSPDLADYPYVSVSPHDLLGHLADKVRILSRTRFISYFSPNFSTTGSSGKSG